MIRLYRGVRVNLLVTNVCRLEGVYMATVWRIKEMKSSGGGGWVYGIVNGCDKDRGLVISVNQYQN